VGAEQKLGASTDRHDPKLILVLHHPDKLPGNLRRFFFPTACKIDLYAIVIKEAAWRRCGGFARPKMPELNSEQNSPRFKTLQAAVVEDKPNGVDRTY